MLGIGMVMGMMRVVVMMGQSVAVEGRQRGGEHMGDSKGKARSVEREEKSKRRGAGTERMCVARRRRECERAAGRF